MWWRESMRLIFPPSFLFCMWWLLNESWNFIDFLSFVREPDWKKILKVWNKSVLGEKIYSVSNTNLIFSVTTLAGGIFILWGKEGALGYISKRLLVKHISAQNYVPLGNADIIQATHESNVLKIPQIREFWFSVTSSLSICCSLVHSDISISQLTPHKSSIQKSL